MPNSGKDLLNEALKAGWKIKSQKGSHVKVEKNGICVTIPVHSNRDLPKGTELAIRKQLGLIKAKQKKKRKTRKKK